MPKRVADVGEGNKDSNGVYGIIRDLIVEGKDARFVNKKGRYVLNWPRALDCFTDYKGKKNPQFKSKKITRRDASNGFRSALLNYYKKEGAKEYKESKKVNEKDEVVERQFQMPPRLFESMFGDVKPTDDSEEDEQDTSSIASESDHKAEVIPSSGTSDTGFDEVMDISFNDLPITAEPINFTVPGELPTDPCLDAIKTEEDNFLSDITIPQASQMFDTSMLDSALEEIFSDGTSDEGMDLLGVVQDICPPSGPMKGGIPFHISLTKELPDGVTSGLAQFEGVADVAVQKLNPFTLSGIVPSSQEPGDVPVSIVTETGQRLGMTCFKYVDEMREMVRQLVKDQTLQSLWFVIWSQEHGFFGNDSDITQMLGPLNMQDQDSSVQTKQQQSLKVLQLLVYTAAQTDAQQFIEMIFSTSAGQIVFNSYKDRMPLPEDIARANGHEELAQYLQDINTRLSKETSCNVQSNAVDWLELVKAVQKQASVGQDESCKQLQHPCENDDNSSDYFADAETSSSGSFDLDTGWSDSEDKGPCTKVPKVQVPTERPATSEQGPSCEIPVTVSDSKTNKESVSTWGYAYSLSEWLSKWRKREDTSMEQNASLDKEEKTESSTFQRLPGVTYFSGLFGKGDDTSEANVHGTSKTNTAKPKEYGQRNHVRSSRRTEAGIMSMPLFALVLIIWIILLIWIVFKLGEGQILHWAVGNGYTQISTILLHCGLFVDALGFLKQTPLHSACSQGHLAIVDILIQHGGNVNARNAPWQETPLHLAAQHGHQHIAEFLIQHGSKVNARNFPWQDTPLHLAAKNGRKHVADVLIQHGSDVNARNDMKQIPLHLAAQSGHKHVAKVLIQHGSDVNARSVPLQETPLHLAAENGHKHVAEVLLQHGSNVNARNSRHLNTWFPIFYCRNAIDCIQITPLHLEAENGHHGSDINAKNNMGQCLLHLTAQHGHKPIAEVLIQHGCDVNTGWLTPLHLSSLNGHKDISEFLIRHGSDVNARSQITPLHLAAEKGHKQVSELLIRHGGDVNAQSEQESTPLHVASANGHKHVVELLIQHGGYVNARSLQENTPLHVASANGHKHVVELLIQHGGDVNATNAPWQETPLHLAVENGHQHAAEVLIQHNSDIGAKNNLELAPIYVVARNGHIHIVDVFMQHRSDAHHVVVEYRHKQPSEVLIPHGSDAKAQGGVKQNAFHLAKRCLSTTNRQARLKPIKVVLEQPKTQSQQVNFADPVNWSLLFDVSRPQSCSKKRNRSYLYHQRCSSFKEEPVDFNCVGKRCHYSQSNDKAKDTRYLHHQMCVPCADRTDITMHYTSTSDVPNMHYTSAVDVPNISSDSFVFNSSNRKTGEVLSWYGLIADYTGKCPENSINKVLMDSEVHPNGNSYDQQQHFKIIQLVGLIVVFTVVLYLFYINLKRKFIPVYGQRVCLQKPVSTFPSQDNATTTTEATRTKTKSGELNQSKEETTDERSLLGIYAHDRWTKGGSKSGNVTQKYCTGMKMGNQQIEDLCIEDASMEDLRMERVKSWLACDCDQEDLPCVDSGGTELKMLREVPYTLINELSTYLNPGGRWKDLGGRLNFTHTQISNFVLVKNNATQAMLEEWGQRDYATVVTLQKVFHSMKWSKEERICAEYV